MARHLLDSDALIFTLRGNRAVTSFIEGLLQSETPVISALSFFEIWVGVRPNEEKAVLNFLSSLYILPVDEPIAREAGAYSREFRKKGITLGAIDSLIAATAKVHSLVLVTGNLRDYPMADIEKLPMPK